MSDELYSTATREMVRTPILSPDGIGRTGDQSCAGAAWDFSTRMPPSRWILDALDTLIRWQDAAAGRQVCLEAALDKRAAEMAVGHGAGLTDWILGLAVAPARRIVGAQQTTDYVMEYLRTLSQQAGESIQALAANTSRSRPACRPTSAEAATGSASAGWAAGAGWSPISGCTGTLICGSGSSRSTECAGCRAPCFRKWQP